MAPQSTFIPHHLATFQLYTLLHRDLIPYRYLLVPGGTGTGKSYFVNGFVKSYEEEFKDRGWRFARLDAALIATREDYLRAVGAIVKRLTAVQPGALQGTEDDGAHAAEEAREGKPKRLVLIFENVACSPFNPQLLFYLRDLKDGYPQILPLLIVDEKLLLDTLSVEARPLARACLESLRAQSAVLHVQLSPVTGPETYVITILRRLVDSTAPDALFETNFKRDYCLLKLKGDMSWKESTLSVLRAYLKALGPSLLVALPREVNLHALRRAIETFVTLGRYYLIDREDFESDSGRAVFMASLLIMIFWCVFYDRPLQETTPYDELPPFKLRRELLYGKTPELWEELSHVHPALPCFRETNPSEMHQTILIRAQQYFLLTRASLRQYFKYGSFAFQEVLISAGVNDFFVLQDFSDLNLNAPLLKDLFEKLNLQGEAQKTATSPDLRAKSQDTAADAKTTEESASHD